MNLMKRFGLVVLLVILGALLAASPALAGKPGQSPNTVTRSLVPPKIDAPEPQARGKYTITSLQEWPEWPTLTLTCRRLTPMKQYCFMTLFGDSWNVWWGTYPVRADGNGNVGAELPMGVPAVAWLENDEGIVVLVEH